jgi:hypothetical protein
MHTAVPFSWTVSFSSASCFVFVFVSFGCICFGFFCFLLEQIVLCGFIFMVLAASFSSTGSFSSTRSFLS